MSSSLRSLVADLRGSPERPGCTAQTGACEFQRWGVDHVRPGCCTEHLTELMFFVEDLLDRHGLTHWLDWGVLLGAVRDGQLIPWDVDGDFGALESDVDSILGLAPEVAAAGYHFEVLDGSVRVCYSKVNKLHVDILLWTEQDGWLAPALSFAKWPGMDGHERFPRTYLEAPEEVLLYGKAFAAPSPVHRFLSEHRYGPDYMTPRRPVTNEKLYGGLVSLDEMTPTARDLFERVGAAERRLEEVSRSRFSRFRPWRLWSKSGLPVTPDRARAERLRASVRAEEASPVVETLVVSLALLEQAIEEYESPKRGLRVRRGHRRLVRLKAALAARLTRQPARVGFPFGV